MKRSEHLIVIKARVQTLPRIASARIDWLQQQIPVEKHHLRRFRKYRVPELLDISIDVEHAERINPAAAVSARGDVFEVAENLIALVLLQMLIGDHWIARLGAGVDPVEHLRLFIQVVAESLKMFVPVRILDDDFHFGIDGPRRLED